MKRVLIVEDQPEIRKLIRMTLEYEDFELFEAADGGAGLMMAEKARPDLMLLDVMMPGELDGFQVCRRIKDRPDLRHIKIIMLTARVQQSDLDAGNSAGADAYLTKPFSPLELIDTVSRYVEDGAAAA
jgi:two-component system phosphate regulon response regulator PhoB